MKKLFVIAVLVGAGIAYASSLSVPWFVDQTGTNQGLPPATATIIGLCFVHNNDTADKTCSITYYTQDGARLGPDAPNNTFVIPALSTMAFRPVAADRVDATTNPGGMETPTGVLVPDRPMISSIPGGTKKNGSLVINWVGGSGDVQGLYVQSQNIDGGPTGRIAHFGTLLPPGV